MVYLKRHTKIFRCIISNGDRFLKHSLSYLYCTKYNEYNTSLNCTKACFIYRIAQKNCDTLWAMLGNGWKCILNCVS